MSGLSSTESRIVDDIRRMNGLDANPYVSEKEKAEFAAEHLTKTCTVASNAWNDDVNKSLDGHATMFASEISNRFPNEDVSGILKQIYLNVVNHLTKCVNKEFLLSSDGRYFYVLVSATAFLKYIFASKNSLQTSDLDSFLKSTKSPQECNNFLNAVRLEPYRDSHTKKISTLDRLLVSNSLKYISVFEAKYLLNHIIQVRTDVPPKKQGQSAYNYDKFFLYYCQQILTAYLERTDAKILVDLHNEIISLKAQVLELDKPGADDLPQTPHSNAECTALLVELNEQIAKMRQLDGDHISGAENPLLTAIKVTIDALESAMQRIQNAPSSETNISLQTQIKELVDNLDKINTEKDDLSTNLEEALGNVLQTAQELQIVVENLSVKDAKREEELKNLQASLQARNAEYAALFLELHEQIDKMRQPDGDHISAAENPLLTAIEVTIDALESAMQRIQNAPSSETNISLQTQIKELVDNLDKINTENDNLSTNLEEALGNVLQTAQELQNVVENLSVKDAKREGELKNLKASLQARTKKYDEIVLERDRLLVEKSALEKLSTQVPIDDESFNHILETVHDFVQDGIMHVRHELCMRGQQSETDYNARKICISQIVELQKALSDDVEKKTLSTDDLVSMKARLCSAQETMKSFEEQVSDIAEDDPQKSPIVHHGIDTAIISKMLKKFMRDIAQVDEILPNSLIRSILADYNQLVLDENVLNNEYSGVQLGSTAATHATTTLSRTVVLNKILNAITQSLIDNEVLDEANNVQSVVETINTVCTAVQNAIDVIQVEISEATDISADLKANMTSDIAFVRMFFPADTSLSNLFELMSRVCKFEDNHGIQLQSLECISRDLIELKEYVSRDSFVKGEMRDGIVKLDSESRGMVEILASLTKLQNDSKIQIETHLTQIATSHTEDMRMVSEFKQTLSQCLAVIEKQTNVTNAEISKKLNDLDLKYASIETILNLTIAVESKLDTIYSFLDAQFLQVHGNIDASNAQIKQLSEACSNFHKEFMECRYSDRQSVTEQLNAMQETAILNLTQVNAIHDNVELMREGVAAGNQKMDVLCEASQAAMTRAGDVNRYINETNEMTTKYFETIVEELTSIKVREVDSVSESKQRTSKLQDTVHSLTEKFTGIGIGMDEIQADIRSLHDVQDAQHTELGNMNQTISSEAGRICTQMKTLECSVERLISRQSESPSDDLDVQSRNGSISCSQDPSHSDTSWNRPSSATGVAVKTNPQLQGIGCAASGPIILTRSTTSPVHMHDARNLHDNQERIISDMHTADSPSHCTGHGPITGCSAPSILHGDSSFDQNPDGPCLHLSDSILKGKTRLLLHSVGQELDRIALVKDECVVLKPFLDTVCDFTNCYLGNIHCQGGTDTYSQFETLAQYRSMLCVCNKAFNIIKNRFGSIRAFGVMLAKYQGYLTTITELVSQYEQEINRTPVHTGHSHLSTAMPVRMQNSVTTTDRCNPPYSRRSGASVSPTSSLCAGDSDDDSVALSENGRTYIMHGIRVCLETANRLLYETTDNYIRQFEFESQDHYNDDLATMNTRMQQIHDDTNSNPMLKHTCVAIIKCSEYLMDVETTNFGTNFNGSVSGDYNKSIYQKLTDLIGSMSGAMHYCDALLRDESSCDEDYTTCKEFLLYIILRTKKNTTKWWDGMEFKNYNDNGSVTNTSQFYDDFADNSDSGSRDGDCIQSTRTGHKKNSCIVYNMNSCIESIQLILQDSQWHESNKLESQSAEAQRVTCEEIQRKYRVTYEDTPASSSVQTAKRVLYQCVRGFLLLAKGKYSLQFDGTNTDKILRDIDKTCYKLTTITSDAFLLYLNLKQEADLVRPAFLQEYCDNLRVVLKFIAEFVQKFATIIYYQKNAQQLTATDDESPLRTMYEGLMLVEIYDERFTTVSESKHKEFDQWIQSETISEHVSDQFIKMSEVITDNLHAGHRSWHVDTVFNWCRDIYMKSDTLPDIAEKLHKHLKICTSSGVCITELVMIWKLIHLLIEYIDRLLRVTNKCTPIPPAVSIDGRNGCASPTHGFSNMSQHDVICGPSTPTLSSTGQLPDNASPTNTAHADAQGGLSGGGMRMHSRSPTSTRIQSRGGGHDNGTNGVSGTQTLSNFNGPPARTTTSTAVAQGITGGSAFICPDNRMSNYSASGGQNDAQSLSNPNGLSTQTRTPPAAAGVQGIVTGGGGGGDVCNQNFSRTAQGQPIRTRTPPAAAGAQAIISGGGGGGILSVLDINTLSHLPPLAQNIQSSNGANGVGIPLAAAGAHPNSPSTQTPTPPAAVGVQGIINGGNAVGATLPVNSTTPSALPSPAAAAAHTNTSGGGSGGNVCNENSSPTAQGQSQSNLNGPSTQTPTPPAAVGVQGIINSGNGGGNSLPVHINTPSALPVTGPNTNDNGDNDNGDNDNDDNDNGDDSDNGDGSDDDDGNDDDNRTYPMSEYEDSLYKKLVAMICHQYEIPCDNAREYDLKIFFQTQAVYDLWGDLKQCSYRSGFESKFLKHMQHISFCVVEKCATVQQSKSRVTKIYACGASYATKKICMGLIVDILFSHEPSVRGYETSINFIHRFFKYYLLEMPNLPAKLSADQAETNQVCVHKFELYKYQFAMWVRISYGKHAIESRVKWPIFCYFTFFKPFTYSSYHNKPYCAGKIHHSRQWTSIEPDRDAAVVPPQVYANYQHLMNRPCSRPQQLHPSAGQLCPDGRAGQLYPNGRASQLHRNGSAGQLCPDGRAGQLYPHGRASQQYRNGYAGVEV